ncbi:MAG: PAS domain S-box protein, partial [Pseudomonadales bacterium]|nr:PAS domain S-box protein [Pseudomonadales bacterium]
MGKRAMNNTGRIININRRAFLSLSVFLCVSVFVISLVTIAKLNSNSKLEREAEFTRFSQAQAVQLEITFTKYLRISEQVSSRTKARLTLSEYNDRLLSYKQANQIITDILSDAIRLSPAIISIERFDISGHLIAQVGEESLNESNHLQALPTELSALKAETIKDRLIFTVLTKIVDREGEIVGYDRVAYHADAVVQALKEGADYFPGSHLRIESASFQPVLDLGERNNISNLKSSFVVATPISQTPLVLVASIKRDILNVPLFQELKIVSFTLMSILSLSLLGMYLMGGYFKRLIDTEIELKENADKQLRDVLVQLKLSKKDAVFVAERLQAILDSSGDGIVSLDLDGKITSANKGVKEIFGYGSAHLIGNNINTLVKFNDSDEGDHDVLKSFRNDGGFHTRSISFDGRTHAGTILPIEMVVTRTKLGRDASYVAVMRNVSERRQYEAQLENANNTKTEFLSSMSHELRTPLNSIIGFAQLLKSNLTRELNEDQSLYVDQINANSRHLLELINDILEFAKIDAGVESVDIQPVYLDPFILDLIRALDPSASKNHVLLLFEK